SGSSGRRRSCALPDATPHEGRADEISDYGNDEDDDIVDPPVRVDAADDHLGDDDRQDEADDRSDDPTQDDHFEEGKHQNRSVANTTISGGATCFLPAPTRSATAHFFASSAPKRIRSGARSAHAMRDDGEPAASVKLNIAPKVRSVQQSKKRARAMSPTSPTATKLDAREQM